MTESPAGTDLAVAPMSFEIRSIFNELLVYMCIYFQYTRTNLDNDRAKL